MSNKHQLRWIEMWLGRNRAVIIEVPDNNLFDPHSLNKPTKPSRGVLSILAWPFYALTIAIPAAVLAWFTYLSANYYYQSPYAWLLGGLVAGCFLLEASQQFYKLLVKSESKDRPLALRAIRFFVATMLYFAVLLVASHFVLRIENYWLHFLAGNYSPYVVHHLLLLATVVYSWVWYERLARGKTELKDRQPFGGRSPTSDDEAERRRKELFR